MSTIPDALTFGDLVARTGCAPHVCRYWLQRRAVEPVGQVAHVRLYPAGAVDVIRQSAAARRQRNTGN